jgi:ABC-2 type transport system ATP-binding protein
MDLFQATLKSFHIPIYAQPISTFSKGTMVKFQLAFALAHHPLLYLMDEPTAGLDPIFRRDFLGILQEIVATEKASIILSTHITSDLDKIADYIGFLEGGRLICYEDRETLAETLFSEKASSHLKIADLF